LSSIIKLFSSSTSSKLILEICKLVDLNSDSSRDVSFLAMKEVISGASASTICSESLFFPIIDVLLKYSKQDQNVAEAYEILSILLGRFKGQGALNGDVSAKLFADLSKVFLHLLHTRQNIRKKSGAVFVAAMHALQEKEVDSIMRKILIEVAQNANNSEKLASLLELILNIRCASLINQESSVTLARPILAN
jgi:hypothetical protein